MHFTIKNKNTITALHKTCSIKLTDRIKRNSNKYGRNDLPVLFNSNFGHCETKFCIPYGAMAQMNCSNCCFQY